MADIDTPFDSLLKTPVPYRVELFDLSDAADKKAVLQLYQQKDIRFATDDYLEQLKELFAIEHPADVYKLDFDAKFRSYVSTLEAGRPLWLRGRWAFFPWRSHIAHILDEEAYLRVRTARNQHLITSSEQSKYYNSTIGIAGLSVGSAVALAIVLQGGGKRLRLADMDRLALTNTNRVLAGADRLGELKTISAARSIYELNPYANIELFSDGVTAQNIPKFMDGLDVVIDEIDELSVKCLIREEAKKRRLPVVMAADNGDNAVVDIDRYDLDPRVEYFHGRMGEVTHESLSKLDKFGIGKKITELVGPENVTQRMQESLLEMGKTIVSWPQLGGAALLNGAAVAYCVRKILTGEPLEANRAIISLDEKLVPGWTSGTQTALRIKQSEAFARHFF